jgi:hypothetical protein
MKLLQVFVLETVQVFAACTEDSRPSADGEIEPGSGEGSSDAESDLDVDAKSDADTQSDSDTGGDTESDTGSDTDSDADSDTDSDTDSDSDTDLDADSATDPIADSTPALKSSDTDPTYATSGPWHGYIWPAVDTGGQATISPSAAEGFRGGGPPFCASGFVPSSGGVAVAMIGMNTNQERAGGAVAATWDPSGYSGIKVNVSNPGGSALRLQIQTHETGAIGEEWCAMLTEFNQDVVVLWSDFYEHSRCADKVGEPFSGTMQGIATVMVLVPGFEDYNFDFCVIEMTPV